MTMMKTTRMLTVLTRRIQIDNAVKMPIFGGNESSTSSSGEEEEEQEEDEESVDSDEESVDELIPKVVNVS